ncbi:MAG TPA: DUF2239 family protein [Polyangiaceae bacterium]|nr:DUF2239 family protein [Polyangiaceae bacterium]
MEKQLNYLAFVGPRRVASGSLVEILPGLKDRFERDPSELVLIFEVETGRQIDLDLRGTPEDVLERYAPSAARGPGRPKLGVTSREVSLLPRHWDWLEEQPSGASAALRRLVEAAIKQEPGKERARRIRAALSRFLSAMAGDRPHYEEACRALFAGETAQFVGLIERWPKDIREHATQQAHAAAAAEQEKER